VAFENVELNGYLECIIDNIKSENLGICFDAGHCHLFYDGEFDVNKFKNRVFAIHLHDNFQTRDEHNLPFDGSANWNRIIEQLKSMNYNDYVIIESGYNNYYKDINLLQYCEKAYEVGNKLIEMINNK